MNYQDIDRHFRRNGLRLRGGFDLEAAQKRNSDRAQQQDRAGQDVTDDYDPANLPLLAGKPPSTLLLVGAVGGEFWTAFSQSPEFLDDQGNALDRWSERLIWDAARQLSGTAMFPSDGPPFQPFQLWARLSEPVFPSPLGLLIHPDWGVWHAYRGALILPNPLPDLPSLPVAAQSPCLDCQKKPCLNHCPVGAFSEAGYDVDACAQHLHAGDQANCLQKSCAARRACPLGREHHYDLEQTTFFMSAFLESRPK